jgi:hypothetical protein
VLQHSFQEVKEEAKEKFFILILKILLGQKESNK